MAWIFSPINPYKGGVHESILVIKLWEILTFLREVKNIVLTDRINIRVLLSPINGYALFLFEGITHEYS